MRSIIKAFVVIAALTTTTHLSAQESAESDSSDFDIGQSVEPAVGEAFVRETFGDWAIRCIKADVGQEDACNLYQLLQNDEGVSVAEFNLFQLPQDGQIIAGANIVVPLETFLPEGLTLAVDGENAREYPFRFCNRAGCVARIGLTPEEVAEMQAGAAGSMRIVPAAAPDTEVVLTISLTGFTAAYAAITPLPAE